DQDLLVPVDLAGCRVQHLRGLNADRRGFGASRHVSFEHQGGLAPIHVRLAGLAVGPVGPVGLAGTTSANGADVAVVVASRWRGAMRGGPDRTRASLAAIHG